MTARQKIFFIVLFLLTGLNIYSADMPYFQPYDESNPKSYKVYFPPEIVQDEYGYKFQCMRTVGNNVPLPTPMTMETDTFWKLVISEHRAGNGTLQNFQPWNGATLIKYLPGDLVVYNGILYSCVKEIGNDVLPPDAPANWTLAKYPYSFFLEKICIPYFSVWNGKNPVCFYQGDFVLYNDEIYQCIRSVFNIKSPDGLPGYWELYDVKEKNKKKTVLIILVNQNSGYRTPTVLKIYKTALALGYNTILLADNISSTNRSEFSKEAINYYVKMGFTNFKEKVGNSIFISSKTNIIEYLTNSNAQYIYYNGDGNCTNEGNCTSIACFNGEGLYPSEIRQINFIKGTTFLANACHGANKEFGLAVFDSGIENYAAGVTYLDDFTAQAMGGGTVNKLLFGNNFETAFEKTADNLQSLFKKYNALFWNGAWGYFVNRSDFYNYQLYNYNCSIPNYHNSLFTNFKKIYSTIVNGEITAENWPLKPDGQVMIGTPTEQPPYPTGKVKTVQ